jgi:UTP--glucose-1-phosphate uridylyltransferase
MLVEKPAIAMLQDLAVLGRYILTPSIFDKLSTQTPGKGGEIELTDALMALSYNEPVYAYDFEGERYDVGDRFGYVKAIIDYALRRDDLKKPVQSYLDAIRQK